MPNYEVESADSKVKNNKVLDRFKSKVMEIGTKEAEQE
jgi:hypothetical protein